MKDIDITSFIKAEDSKGFLMYIIEQLIAAHDISPEFHAGSRSHGAI